MYCKYGNKCRYKNKCKDIHKVEDYSIWNKEEKIRIQNINTRKENLLNMENFNENSEKNIIKFFNNCLIKEKDNEYILYNDLYKKWENKINTNGYKLIIFVLYKVFYMLKKYINFIKQNNTNNPNYIENVINQGINLYLKKPSMKENEFTWTKEEYSNYGLQLCYTYFKSTQRFTEMYSLLEKISTLFKNINQQKNINIVSLGGGPGIELYSCELFFEKYFPNIKCNLTCIDNIDTWGIFLEELNYNFIIQDIFNIENDILFNNYDYVILSYIIYNNSEKNISLILKILKNKNIKGILINCRKKENNICSKLKKYKDIYTLHLMNQHKHNDYQLFITSRLDLIIKINKNNLTFKNIPYEYVE